MIAQALIEQGHIVTLFCKRPGGAETYGPSTDDSYGLLQLTPPAAITSE